MALPEIIVRERDQRMFEMKKAGLSYRKIAEAEKVSPATAHAGVKRIMSELAQQYLEDNKYYIVQFNEELEDMKRNLIKFTRTHKQTFQDDDGVVREQEMPPSLDAVDRVLKIKAMQAKIFGLEKDVVLHASVGQQGAPDLTPEETLSQTPEELGRATALEFLKAGVLSGPEAEMLAQLLHNGAIDVESEEVPSERRALPAGPELQKPQPPEWIDDDERDYMPGSWLPDEE